MMGRIGRYDDHVIMLQIFRDGLPISVKQL